MATVRVEPLGIDLHVEEDESVIQAAWREGYTWPTVCRGEGTCVTCFVTVLEGAEALAEPGRLEAETLERSFRGRIEGLRLACQLRPLGDVTVRKRGVKKAES